MIVSVDNMVNRSILASLKVEYFGFTLNHYRGGDPLRMNLTNYGTQLFSDPRSKD